MLAPCLNFAGLRGEDTMRSPGGGGGVGVLLAIFGDGEGNSTRSPNPDPLSDQGMNDFPTPVLQNPIAINF